MENPSGSGESPHAVPAQELLLRHLAFIERVARNGARRHRLRPEDAEEFVSDLKLKLVADDYAVIRKFQGRSSLTTYLTAVVQHALLDFRNRLWGKWRPSAEARRLGGAAVLLERLTVRDGHTTDEAYQVMTINHGIVLSRAEIETLASRLPIRSRGRGEEVPPQSDIEDDAARPDERLEEAERDREKARVRGALERALAALPPEDHLIVRMRMDGLAMPEIARCLHLEAKPLYRRLEGILKGLRDRLESEGVDAGTVAGLDAAPARPPAWFAGREKRNPRSSETLGSS